MLLVSSGIGAEQAAELTKIADREGVHLLGPNCLGFQRPQGDPGLVDTSTFQFVTWTDSGWQVAPLPSDQSLFDESGGFGFAGRVVPLPSAAMMGAIPLLAMAAFRRRNPAR